ncbi:hypothetical protein N7535_009077 [Penicillium sp. DV-2018c]|nr:hypothetical protein N7535_009077 [Penicillium sp. DV-2018c]
MWSDAWSGKVSIGGVIAQYVDGDTLRNRADSFASSADTVVRSRSGSYVDASQVAKAAAYDDISLADVLKPDPRNEADFQVQDNRFVFSLLLFRLLVAWLGWKGGLRTDLNAGLSINEARLEGTVYFEDVTQHTSTGKKSLQETAPVSSGDGSPFEDRIRVFGQNRLPTHKSSFLKLFWDAYNDKIIILLTIAAVVSLSLGIYKTVSDGTGVEWVDLRGFST